jgi:hypothetical protein
VAAGSAPGQNSPPRAPVDDCGEGDYVASVANGLLLLDGAVAFPEYALDGFGDHVGLIQLLERLRDMPLQQAEQLGHGHRSCLQDLQAVAGDAVASCQPVRRPQYLRLDLRP